MVMGFDIASNFARTRFARPGGDVVYGLKRMGCSSQEGVFEFHVFFFWLLVSVHPVKACGIKLSPLVGIVKVLCQGPFYQACQIRWQWQYGWTTNHLWMSFQKPPMVVPFFKFFSFLEKVRFHMASPHRHAQKVTWCSIAVPWMLAAKRRIGHQLWPCSLATFLKHSFGSKMAIDGFRQLCMLCMWLYFTYCGWTKPRKLSETPPKNDKTWNYVCCVS